MADNPSHPLDAFFKFLSTSLETAKNAPKSQIAALVVLIVLTGLTALLVVTGALELVLLLVSMLAAVAVMLLQRRRALLASVVILAFGISGATVMRGPRPHGSTERAFGSDTLDVARPVVGSDSVRLSGNVFHRSLLSAVGRRIFGHSAEQPVANAIVSPKGSAIMTQTDATGAFQLTVPRHVVARRVIMLVLPSDKADITPMSYDVSLADLPFEFAVYPARSFFHRFVQYDDVNQGPAYAGFVTPRSTSDAKSGGDLRIVVDSFSLAPTRQSAPNRLDLILSAASGEKILVRNVNGAVAAQRQMLVAGEMVINTPSNGWVSLTGETRPSGDDAMPLRGNVVFSARNLRPYLPGRFAIELRAANSSYTAGSIFLTVIRMNAAAY